MRSFFCGEPHKLPTVLFFSFKFPIVSNKAFLFNNDKHNIVSYPNLLNFCVMYVVNHAKTAEVILIKLGIVTVRGLDLHIDYFITG